MILDELNEKEEHSFAANAFHRPKASQSESNADSISMNAMRSGLSNS